MTYIVSDTLEFAKILKHWYSYQTQKYVYVYMFIIMYRCVRLCMYLCICLFVFVHLYIYIYTHKVCLKSNESGVTNNLFKIQTNYMVSSSK